jgi:hypothetical protein
MREQMTWEQAKTRHPNEVDQIVSRIRKGRSKFKDTDPTGWTWAYDWGSRAVHLTGNTLEERVESALSRCKGLTYLVGQPNSRSSLEAEPVSVEVLRSWATKCVQQDMDEKARVAAMTPKERQDEIDRLLGWLSDPKTNTGFMALKVGG